MAGENGFDHLDNLVLMVPRELADLLEKAPHFADGTGRALRFDGSFAEKLFSGNAERGSKMFDLFRTECDRLSFPCCITRLSHAELGSELRLGKTSRLASRKQALAERRARTFGRSACLHVGNIRGRRRSYR